MRNILVCALLIPCLCSFKKDKKERPKPAIAKGSLSAIGVFGIPEAVWRKPTANRSVTRGSLLTGAEYQVARWFSTGLLLSYHASGTGMQPVYNRSSGTPYQRDIKTQHGALFATADFYYLNRGKFSIGSGIAFGPMLHVESEHVIDSMGISTYRKPGSYLTLDLELRLLNARVRIADNFAVFAGWVVSTGTPFGIGAHYTFVSRK